MPKQNRELKNRVREIRSHGSVRGMGCKSHLYSEGILNAQRPHRLCGPTF